MKKLFKNYKKWCKYLDRKSSFWLPTIQQEVQQRKLLYMGLYLLIWGEAANLRIMPECLCYIYHHTTFELYGMLAGNISPMTGERVRLAYGGDEEAFLRKVVAPICNYKGWPMCVDANFFCPPMEQLRDKKWGKLCLLVTENEPADKDRWIGKVNFVEIGSFLQIFRSFDRMWSFDETLLVHVFSRKNKRGNRG
ncbi:hypothetical protein Pint_31298 [Pistacia integerrima]|uniref:Uncharacterized protein n=1 Tax=Pistacia integerrima TaxID=434235 RepID=A0ACC0XL22_9ROSI|nr:hypothetical protein Pint_31298 [Pistacia integerrima]